ncbi:MAG: FISUMP domain-containing protein [Bacteroidales bacterium]
MKIYYIFLWCCFSSVSLFSQTQITLIFEGKDSVDQNFVSLDSVNVINLTENCDTIVYGPVPVLSLVATLPVEVDEISINNGGEFILEPNYPNPFNVSTNVRIYRAYSGPLNLMLFDGLGRKLAEYHNEFDKGIHSFVISTSLHEVLFLAVFDNMNNRSIKIISTGEGQVSNTIHYLGQTLNVKKRVLKSQNNSGFIFYLGNQMKYTANANGYIDQTLFDIPITDSTYFFNMPMLYLPSVTTSPVIDITQTTATSGGDVTSDGGATISERGVCWSTMSNPTTDDFYTTDGSGTGSFISYLNGLTPNTPYYIKAYATNSEGIGYGNEIMFTTGQSVTTPIVITAEVTSITQTTATSGGEVVYDGGSGVTARGVCWNITPNPTTTGNHTTDGTGTGLFISNMTGLSGGTLYYVRAYATNSAGTSYGSELSFTTITLPTVTTAAVTSITDVTATSGGNVSSDGGATVTARGVCWSISPNPATMESHTTDGTGTGSFVSNIIGLAAGTFYYVRAYTTNSAGTSYGNELTFTTLSLPTVLTTAVTGITQTTATSGGNVTSDGGATITAKGVCWSISSNPTIINDHTADGTGTGAFISNLTGLSPMTLYYVRAYATNSLGTNYGDQVSFTTIVQPPCPGLPTVILYEGKTYHNIQIGNQCWLKENLNVGTRVDNWQGQDWANGTIEKYCYNNLESNCDIYGGLYSWDEMMQNSVTPGVQGISPPGWHIPTYAEWTTMSTYLGGVNVAGGKLKEIGTNHWLNPNTGATNEFGFTALPGGYTYTMGLYDAMGVYGFWWTSSEYTNTSQAWHIEMDYSSPTIYYWWPIKGQCISVRCVRDHTPGVTTAPTINITQTSATCGGEAVSEGDSPITAKGLCWNISQNPTIADNHNDFGPGLGEFTSNLSGFSPNTIYYLRSYATNSFGTAYGNQVKLITTWYPCPGIPTVLYEGHTYNTLLIGSQCWFRENLNVGTRINCDQDQNPNNDTIEKHCLCDNDSNCDVYGGLYQWSETMQGSTAQGAQGICPTGWHIPTDDEWSILITYLGGYSIAGGKLKEWETAHWNYPNTGANNESGFTALPGGDNINCWMHQYGWWWSSSSVYTSGYYFPSGYYLQYESGGITHDNFYLLPYSFSVRCIKD